MKKTFRFISAVAFTSLLAATCWRCSAQGFINLDFESAAVSDLPAGQWEFVNMANGLPGWNGYWGTNQITTQATHNSHTVGAVNVGVLGPNYAPSTEIIAGRYSAIVQAGIDLSGNFVSATIAQIGLVPASAKSVVFSSISSLDPLFFNVSLDGQVIPMVRISTMGSYALFGGDVSSFAGRSAVLRITALPVGPPGTGFPLDNIAFVIPEPSAVCLFALGAALFGWRFVRKRT